ncbi:Uncharacterised protein [Serratia proteamaculans]|nr:Uncharacterised protein [Serratia proteamaculans]CAI1137589.1 Uncharacterised protein [Serratia proteamaculans]
MNILSMIFGSHFPPSPLRVQLLIAITSEARSHSGVSYYFSSPLECISKEISI